MKATKYADGFATFLNAFKDPEAESAEPPAEAEASGGASMEKVIDVLKTGPRSIPELVQQSDLDLGGVVDTVGKLTQVGLVQSTGPAGSQQFELTTSGEQLAG